MKTFKIRSRAVENGKDTFVDLHLEFDGERAFVIWDSIPVGAFELKARLEIDPDLLQRVSQIGCDYVYRGQLVLPHPENN